MTDSFHTDRTCPYCREAIKSSARKCPHCQQWLGRWALATHPAVYFLWMMVIFLALGIMFYSRFNFGISDSDNGYQSQIRVVESAMHYTSTDEKCGPTLSVVGKIRNDSEIHWKDIFLEAQYFDTTGTMIDTEGSEQYGLVILPHQEVAFRISSTPVRPQHDYADHKVFVRSARDARTC